MRRTALMMPMQILHRYNTSIQNASQLGKKNSFSNVLKPTAISTPIGAQVESIKTHPYLQFCLSGSKETRIELTL